MAATRPARGWAGVLTFSLVMVAMMAVAAAPRMAVAQNAPSVLDRIRAKMREEATKNRGGNWFDRLDADKSGDISRQELFDGVRRQFRAMDTNHDGYLSRQEYLHDSKNVAAGTARFRQLDANGDGRLDLTEFAAPADLRFDQLDLNHDGRISRAEADRLFAGPDLLGKSGGTVK